MIQNIRTLLAACILGVCIALIGCPPAHSQVVGGFPSRPRFSSVGVNSAVPAQGLTVTGGASNDAITANAGANNFAGTFQGNVTSGQSFGLYVPAGTTSADKAILVRNQGGTVQFFAIDGTGAVFIGLTQQFTSGCSIGTIDQTVTSQTTLTTLCQTGTIPVGTYRFSVQGNFSEVTSGVGGISLGLSGGTATIVMDARTSCGLVNAATSCNVAGTFPRQDYATVTTTTCADGVTITGQLRVTAAGSIGLGLGQVASSANATRLCAGAALSLTRVPF